MIRTADIQELKRRYKNTEEVSITRMRGVYVSSDKEILCRIDESFLCLPEEEFYKYLEIVKAVFQPKSLDNKNLEMEFAQDDMKMCLANISTDLSEKEELERLYETIIENYISDGEYLILIFYDTYDIPGKTGDGAEIEDAEEVYQHVICAICPVSLDKAGLQYAKTQHKVCVKQRNWIVQTPAAGFIYPAFEERSVNSDKMLYYCKNPKKLQCYMIEAFGLENRKTAEQYREEFENVVYRATESMELTDRYLEKINLRLREFLLEEDSILQKPLEKEWLEKIMKEENIPEIHAKFILNEFTKMGNKKYVKAKWLYNRKIFSAASRKAERDKIRSLMARASKGLQASGQQKLSEEIEAELEKWRINYTG